MATFVSNATTSTLAIDLGHLGDNSPKHAADTSGNYDQLFDDPETTTDYTYWNKIGDFTFTKNNTAIGFWVLGSDSKKEWEQLESRMYTEGGSGGEIFNIIANESKYDLSGLWESTGGYYYSIIFLAKSGTTDNSSDFIYACVSLLKATPEKSLSCYVSFTEIGLGLIQGNLNLRNQSQPDVYFYVFGTEGNVAASTIDLSKDEAGEDSNAGTVGQRGTGSMAWDTDETTQLVGSTEATRYHITISATVH